MKIQGPGSTQGTSKSKKSSQTSGADGSFGDFLSAGEADSASAAGPTQSIAKIDALLMAQETDDPAGRAAKNRMKQRGNDILDELESLRIGMLTGNMTLGHMVDVADVVATHRENISDPALTAIIDEIDLRAQVELAKMRMAMERK